MRTDKVLTELQIACWFNNRDKVKKLLDLGEDVNLQNACGRTALHYATGREDIEELLIARGGDWNIKDDSGLSAGDDVRPERSGNSNMLLYSAIRDRQSLETTLAPVDKSGNRTHL